MRSVRLRLIISWYMSKNITLCVLSMIKFWGSLSHLIIRSFTKSWNRLQCYQRPAFICLMGSWQSVMYSVGLLLVTAWWAQILYTKTNHLKIYAWKWSWYTPQKYNTLCPHRDNFLGLFQKVGRRYNVINQRSALLCLMWSWQWITRSLRLLLVTTLWAQTALWAQTLYTKNNHLRIGGHRPTRQRQIISWYMLRNITLCVLLMITFWGFFKKLEGVTMLLSIIVQLSFAH